MSNPAGPEGAQPTPPIPGATPPAPEYAAPPAAGAPAPEQPAQGYAPPAYPAAPAPPASPPGRGLAIAGLIFAFVMPLIGLILSIIATVKLGKVGAPKGMAIAGIIISIVIMVIEIIVAIVLIGVFVNLIGTCADLGPGVWEINGVTYECG